METVLADNEQRERVGEIFVPSDGGERSLRAVAKDFYEGEIGKHFEVQPLRFSVSYPLSKTESFRYLGPDTSPIGHQVTLANWYIPQVIRWNEEGSQRKLSPEDKALVTFIAMFHDIGESTHPGLARHGLTVVGDIPAGQKSDDARQYEAKIRQFIWKQPPFSTIDSRFIERAEAIIMHKPEPSDEGLHVLFEVAHSLQSYDTSVIAGYAVETRRELDKYPETKIVLGKLATVVCAKELAILQTKYWQVPGVSDALTTAARRKKGPRTVASQYHPTLRRAA